jgi:hypothetical protein
VDIGQKVTYVVFDKVEHGIVKGHSDLDYVFVVYNCAGNWDRYFDYTAARTRIRDLFPGWIEDRAAENSGAVDTLHNIAMPKLVGELRDIINASVSPLAYPKGHARAMEILNQLSAIA